MQGNGVKSIESATGLPLTKEGVADFLSGHWVEGIGPAFAKRLTDAFGIDALHILIDEPEKAAAVPGLGESRVKAASESLRALKFPLDLLAFLYSCGVSDLYVGRILGKYRGKTLQKIIEDPYDMVEDVWRLSFYTADKIGRALSIPADDPRRLRGALLTAVKQYAEEGHLFATATQACNKASRMTGIEEDKIAGQIPGLADSGRLICSMGGLYLPVFYEAEREGAEKLSKLAAMDVEKIDIDEIPLTNSDGLAYSESQRLAIYKALNSPVMVLTGGPGSGKTTVLRGVIDVLERRGKKIVLAAPTGRAAKRMTALTGVEATTIHRLLGYREGQGWQHRQVDADVLIIDEGSMMEQVLFKHLLDSISPSTRIILVGDVDQLPSIGAGDVMRDMIKSRNVPVATLSENFRQKEGGGIAGSAKAINMGMMPETVGDDEFMMVPENSLSDIRDRIITLMTKELPEKYNISPHEIQVVTPQQIGPLGARRLNVDLQKVINPDNPELRRGGTILRLGDPVMQTSNSPQRDLYNGEIGKIVDVRPELQKLTVEFANGRTSEYSRSELSELTLAYATTVHKLQGSEVKYMIMPVTMAHRPMLYRNLLYTGVSRARVLCVLVGEEEALRYAVGNNPDSTRNSNFRRRLSFRSDT